MKPELTERQLKMLGEYYEASKTGHGDIPESQLIGRPPPSTLKAAGFISHVMRPSDTSRRYINAWKITPAGIAYWQEHGEYDALEETDFEEGGLVVSESDEEEDYNEDDGTFKYEE